MYFHSPGRVDPAHHPLCCARHLPGRAALDEFEGIKDVVLGGLERGDDSEGLDVVDTSRRGRGRGGGGSGGGSVRVVRSRGGRGSGGGRGSRAANESASELKRRGSERVGVVLGSEDSGGLLLLFMVH